MPGYKFMLCLREDIVASVLFVVAFLVCYVCLTAAALAWTSRRLKTLRRGRWISLGVVLSLGVVTAFTNGLGLWVSAKNLGGLVAVLVLQLVLVFLTLKIGFAAQRRQPWWLFGSWVIVQVVTMAMFSLIVRPFCFEGFVIPTGSMSPTLVMGDRFLVNKFATPRRWEIIAYFHHDFQGTVVYCKRLVGLPGERLRFVDGNLLVNDQPVVAPTILAGRMSLDIRGRGKYHGDETITLGPDEIFVIGDNVDASFDSRAEGPSSAKDIIGVGEWLYYPFSRGRLLR